ncbi:MAG: DUF1214 domain-containing protein [Oscillospiraceae bacterium]|nr:DUF1214 domain-containing protein [Oscillospiraceae bacterium]
MKFSMKKITAILIAFALSVSVLTACEGGQTNEQVENAGDIENISQTHSENNEMETEMSDEEIIETALTAYKYAIPLIMMDLTKKSTTNMNPARLAASAPLNQFFHAKTPPPAEEKTVVRLNIDTLYSLAFLRIFDEPIIMEKPKTDVYCSVSVLDAYSNSAAVLGTGGMDDGEAAVYAFCNPSFDGDLPDGVVQIDVPTDIVWVAARTSHENTPDSLAKAHAAQEQFSLIPLSEYGNEDYILPEGEFNEEYVFVPLQKLFSLSIDEFFNSFNELAVKNPGTVQDAPYLEEFSKIGVGPGLEFNIDGFSSEVQTALNALPGQVMANLMNNDPNAEGSIYAKSFHTVNNWMFPDASIADFGTDYDFRALIAVILFGANPVEMAVYPGCNVDINNNPLNGNNNYTMRFEQGELPPFLENGFWSITLYDASGFLYPNPQEKQGIRNIDPLVVDSDGSVTIYLQNESPGGDLEANWLPAPKEEFTLTLRVYLPDESVTDFSWKPPYVVS